LFAQAATLALAVPGGDLRADKRLPDREVREIERGSHRLLLKGSLVFTVTPASGERLVMKKTVTPSGKRRPR
jgi:hypothetical protein